MLRLLSLAFDAPQKLALLVEIEKDVPARISLRNFAWIAPLRKLDHHVPLLPFAASPKLAGCFLGATGLRVSLSGGDCRSFVCHLGRLGRCNDARPNYRDTQKAGDCEPHMTWSTHRA
jgi:hypothetical protein